MDSLSSAYYEQKNLDQTLFRLGFFEPFLLVNTFAQAYRRGRNNWILIDNKTGPK